MNKRTILIADDEYGFRYPFRIYLKHNDFDVLEASNKDETFKKISDADLLMMDVVFPSNKEGIEIVNEIRNSEDGKIKNIPVIFFSILSESMCAGELLEDVKPYTWLQKPFEFETLVNEINKLIS